MATFSTRRRSSAAGAGVTGRRPPAATAMVVVLFFLGVTAVGGGVALIIGRGAAPPQAWLDRIPIVDSWTVPGLVLALGFGVGSLITAYGVLSGPSRVRLAGIERLTGHHWSWSATVLLGLGQAAWLGLEMVYLPALSPLQFVYAGVAVALLVLASLRSTRTYLRPGNRAGA